VVREWEDGHMVTDQHIGLVRIGGPTEIVIHDGLQGECRICARIKEVNGAREQRGAPVALAEMTRRRDSWREKAQQLERQLAVVKAAMARLEWEAANRNRELESARYYRINADNRSEHAWNEVRRLTAELAARNEEATG